MISRFREQISGFPAFSTGMSLISLAPRISLADAAVKMAQTLTFHFVVSQSKAWRDKMVPEKTKVHS
jgi:hypothetical protein